MGLTFDENILRPCPFPPMPLVSLCLCSSSFSILIISRVSGSMISGLFWPLGRETLLQPSGSSHLKITSGPSSNSSKPLGFRILHPDAGFLHKVYPSMYMRLRPIPNHTGMSQHNLEENEDIGTYPSITQEGELAQTLYKPTLLEDNTLYNNKDRQWYLYNPYLPKFFSPNGIQNGIQNLSFVKLSPGLVRSYLKCTYQ